MYCSRHKAPRFVLNSISVTTKLLRMVENSNPRTFDHSCQKSWYKFWHKIEHRVERSKAPLDVNFLMSTFFYLPGFQSVSIRYSDP